MRSLCLNTLVIICVIGCSSNKLHDGPHDIGAVLNQDIPNSWHCVTDDSSITIRYKNTVDKLNMISLPAPPTEDLLEDFGWKGDFFIRLRFVKKLSEAEYYERVHKRERLISHLNEDDTIDGRTKFGMEQEIISNNPIPTYFNDDFTIFLELSEPSYVKVFPQDAAEEHRLILQQIEKLFIPYNHES